MKKVIAVVIAVILVLIVGIVIGVSVTNDKGNTRQTNDKAEKDEKNRYLTIINKTGEIINEVHITVGEGTEIEQGYQKNPDEDSFSVKIPKDYEEYDSFTVTLIDRYELKYETTVKNVKEKGRTEVVVTKDDYVKQDGDWKKKLDDWFNAD